MSLALEELLDPSTSSYKKRDLLRASLESFDGSAANIQKIRQVLSDSENSFRRDILDLLSRYQIQEFLEDIIAWLDNDDQYLSRDVLNYLEKNGTANCLEKVRPFCDHKSYTVSYAAKRALESLEKKFPKVESSNEVQSIEITIEEPESNDVSPVLSEDESSETVNVASSEVEDEQELSGTVDIPSTKNEEEQDDSSETSKENKVSWKIDSASPSKEKEENKTPNTESTKEIEATLGELELENDFATKELEFVSEECYQKIFLEENAWKKAHSLKLFFDEDFEQAKQLYQELYSALTQYPALEHKLHSLTLDLQLYQADKQDDISESEEALRQSRNQAQSLDGEVKKISGELSEFKEKRESFFNSIVNTLFSDREQDQEHLQRAIEARLKEKEEAEEKARQTIETHQETKDSLLKPLQALEKAIKDKEVEKKKLEKQIEKSRQKLWKDFASRLLKIDTEKRHDLLEKITERVKNKDFFKQVCLRLSENIQKLTLLEKTLLDSRTELKMRNAEAHLAIDKFSDSLSRGFVHKTEAKRSDVKINAELYFSEERGFFGFSGADGRAKGHGTTYINYEIDHLTWQSPEDLGTSYQKLMQEAQLEGQESARLFKLEWQHKVLELTLRNELLYFRKTLEEDFYV